MVRYTVARPARGGRKTFHGRDPAMIHRAAKREKRDRTQLLMPLLTTVQRKRIPVFGDRHAHEKLLPC